MKKRLLLVFLALMLLIPSAYGETAEENDVLLYLSFDEGQGAVIQDQSGHLEDANIQYQYLAPAYTDPMDPQWREIGVKGGSLLFEGASTYVAYAPEDICLSGNALTISVWVAPRAFEWDDPNAAPSGIAHLTTIIGQYYKPEYQGILLGYQRFGRLCFEVGTGDDWFTLWTDEGRLQRNAWNHIAAVFDGDEGRMNLYLNGENAATTRVFPDSVIEPAVREMLLIGKNGYGEQIAAGNYQMFSGLMDELCLYDTALSEEEIAALADKAPGEIPYEEIGLENILTGDVFKTQYHGGPYQHWMNEPHAPVYYNGMYHLFFQSNSIGTYWRNICWGHLVSEDTVHWRQIQDAIVPMENSVVPDGVWSGGAALDKNGVPILFFTAGNDSYRSIGLISNQNIGAAYPADLNDPELTEWIVCDELAIAQQPGQGKAGEFRDSHIWKEGDDWYMLICSGTEAGGGTALLYVTDRLEVLPDGTIDMDWQYKGPIFEMENQSVVYGTSWELPILLPLTNKAGTITRYAFFITPAPASIADNKVYYFLGDFDKETGKFTPDADFALPKLVDYGGNVFTGPSVLLDPVTGKVDVFSIMQDQRPGPEQAAAGWAHSIGLTRNIFLNDEGTSVCIVPDERVYHLLDQELLSLENVTMDEANQALEAVSGDLLYIKAVLEPQDQQNFGLTCKAQGRRNYTSFTYYTAKGTMDGFTSNRAKDAKASVVEGEVPLKDGKLTMEIFIDRSLVEGYFNSDKAISVRSYADFAAQQIKLFADGEVQVDELKVYTVSSIYQ
ncbi:MAG: LamG-like jellyroll fold domain-containing protein [Clostridia bacterium]|nr:LamG-like jellyroll fold domain-containing protein [Clostridia bacterium]